MTHDPLRAFASGAIAGLFTSGALQPFDVVKTRLQASATPLGMVETARGIVRLNGVGALWSGVVPACLRVGGGAGLYFLCLSSTQKALAERWPKDRDGSPRLASPRTFSLGAFSRATAAVVFCPITVVKTRMEYAAVSGERFRGTWHALSTIARTERLRGLFSGLGPTLLRDAPYSGLYLLLFSHLRGALGEEGKSSPATSFVAGALAGGLATCATHPPDVVRTRMQLRRSMLRNGSLVGAQLPAVGFREIVRREGVRALYAGIAPRLVRRMLQQGMMWTLFELLFQDRLC